MSFEEEIAELAAQRRQQEQAARRFRDDAAAAARETIDGFVRLLRGQGFTPVPIFGETIFKRGRILQSAQYFEQYGEGWYLSVPGDGGSSSMAISVNAQVARGVFLNTPRRSAPYGHGVAYRGLPRSGYYIYGSKPHDVGGLDGDELSAIRTAAVAIVNGGEQYERGSASSKWVAPS